MNLITFRTLLILVIVCLIAGTPMAIGKTFAGNECTDDCSGHLAGYRWAQDHDIDDPDDCGGNSESFIEGCRAYAQGESPDIEDVDNDDDDDDPPSI